MSQNSSFARNPARTVVHVPPIEPGNQQSASLLPSALNSPTNSIRAASHHSATASQSSAPASPESPPDAASAVDKTPAIIGYFGYILGGAFGVFCSLILKERGFSKRSTGLIVSCVPLFSMTLLPALSYIADKYHCTVKLLLLFAVGSVVATFGFVTIADPAVTVVLFLAVEAFMCPMNPMLDQQTLMMFPKEGRSAAWSYVRSFGAYGYGIGSVLASVMVMWTGSWLVLAFQYMAGQAALIYCVMTIKPYEEVSKKTTIRFLDVLKLLRTNLRVLLFLCAACLMGTGYSFINNFLFLFLDELGGSTFLMGLTVLLTVSTEIPLFQMSDRIAQIFSERQMICLAMGIWSIRVLGYSFLQNPWVVLLLEPLHGVTFAFMWLPSMHLMSCAFPAHLSNSATGVLFTFTSGIGPIIGNLIAGNLYEQLGARAMFRIGAVSMIIGLALYLGADLWLEKKGVPLVIDPDAAAEMVVVENEREEEDEMNTVSVEPGKSKMPKDSSRDSDVQGGCAHLSAKEEELPL